MRNAGHPVILTLLVAVLLGTPGVEAALTIDGSTPATNYRFANDAGFIGANQDWSGVAITQTITERWLTMISPNVFLSANHYHPASGASVTFYASNDPSGASVTRTVSGGQQIGSSDLWIGTINAPLGVAYTYYEHATEPISGPTGFANSVYFGEDVYMVGRASTSWQIPRDVAVGANVLDTWFLNITAGDTTDDALGAAQDSSGDVNYRIYESYLQSGDSGGPLFVEDAGAPGGLRLVGINWFTWPDEVGAETYYSGFSYVGNYADGIQTYLDLHSVPEPRATALTVGLMVLGYGLVRRRAGAGGRTY